LFVFFSSRRRHTRSKRDWSSDVCSSDLAFAHRVRKPDDAFFIDIADEATASTAVGATDLAPVTVFLEMKPVLTHGRADFRRLHRSEERRVGNEGSARCAERLGEVRGR